MSCPVKRCVLLALSAGALAALLLGCGPVGAGGPSMQSAETGDLLDVWQGDFTILLRVFQGPIHAELAGEWKNSLSRGKGWTGLVVVTKVDHSALYWGQYKTRPAAKPALKQARAHRDQRGNQPLSEAVITLSPGSDKGPPMWNLLNCRGSYSLLVATFADEPSASHVGRRDFAVAYCRQLRHHGRPAYYHHGPSNSSVTIGSFGPGAVTRRPARPRASANKGAGASHLTVVDAELLALRREFPQRLWNGRLLYDIIKDARGNKVGRRKVASVPIRVPRKKDGQLPSDGGSGHEQPW